MKRKAQKYGLLKRVLWFSAFAGFLLLMPYLVFWALSVLGHAVEYGFMTVIAFWVLIFALGFSFPPRKTIVL